MRTSISLSLALMCLYSLYSTAKGERSSFCTFLWQQQVGGSKIQTLAEWTTVKMAVQPKMKDSTSWVLASSNCLHLVQLWHETEPEMSSYLPFCLKNWSSNSLRFLRILFFSSRASCSCSTSSGLCVGEEANTALGIWTSKVVLTLKGFKVLQVVSILVV